MTSFFFSFYLFLQKWNISNFQIPKYKTDRFPPKYACNMVNSKQKGWDWESKIGRGMNNVCGTVFCLASCGYTETRTQYLKKSWTLLKHYKVFEASTILGLPNNSISLVFLKKWKQGNGALLLLSLELIIWKSYFNTASDWYLTFKTSLYWACVLVSS